MNLEENSLPKGHRDTRTRLLDEAERLFALKGVKGTSIRELSSAAGANLAAVNYHFGSKEGLVRAVFARRIRPINREREKRLGALLEKARETGGRPEVPQVVKAFVEPAFNLMKSSRSTHFITFVGRAMADPDPTVRNLFIEEMKETIRLFFMSLEEALPGIPEERLFLRLQFLIGALGHFYSGRFRSGPLSEEIDLSSIDELEVLEEFVTFVSYGLEAES